MNEVDLDKEQEEKEAEAVREKERKQVGLQEKEDVLESEFQSRREQEERNEAYMRRIKEDAAGVNESMNVNIKNALASLASLTRKKTIPTTVSSRPTYSSISNPPSNNPPSNPMPQTQAPEEQTTNDIIKTTQI